MVKLNAFIEMTLSYDIANEISKISSSLNRDIELLAFWYNTFTYT